MGVFDLSDMRCDCACPGHSLRRELERQVAELRQKNALLEEAVRQLEETVSVCWSHVDAAWQS